MAAALLWTRANLRSQWRSAALVVLIAGLCAAVAMAAIAGARRTTTSYDRFVRATKDLNIFVSVPDQETADLAASVLRSGIDPRFVVEAAFLAVKPATLDKSDEFNLGVIGGVAATSDRAVALSKVVSGRVPTGSRDIGVNDLAAQRFGVGPGDHIHMVGYTPAALQACWADPSACATDLDLGEVTVSGVLRQPSDISPEASDSLSIEASPSLTKSWLRSVATQGWLSGAFVESSSTRASLGTALTSAIGPDRISGPSADVFLDADSQADPERVQGALDVEHNGLLTLGLLACLAGLIAVPQALACHRASAASEDPSLRGLGWTQRNQRRAGAIWSAMLGLAAAAVAVVAAIAISPLFPIGLARRAEPSPGIDADWFVLSVGALLTFLVLLGAGALVNPHRNPLYAKRPSRLVKLLSASRPVPSTAGRFLLDSGRLSPVARTTLSAAVFGVAMIACAATVIHSQDYLVDRPQLYGAPWDVQGAVSGESADPDALNALNANAGVAASALLTGGRLDADGQSIGAVAIDHLKGSIEPTMLTGRTILNDGEVVLGPAFMHSHHLSVGDPLSVQTAGTLGTLTIVGTGVPVSVGSYSSDVGAIMTPADFERYGTPSTIDNEGGLELAVRLAPGADMSAVRGDMAPITGGFERVIGSSFRPARILNFSRVKSVPQIVEAFAALLTLLVLMHSLATVATRRRHDLSVLRAIGMKPRQARRVLWWYGGILAALAVAVGIPLGVLVGRLLWHAVSKSIDSVYVPRSPWLLLVTFAGGLLAVSVAAGAALSRRAVPHPIARSLRSE